MWPHFLNLAHAAGHNMLAKTGTTTLGFILWTLGFTVLGWAAVIAAKWFITRNYKQKKHFGDALKEWLLTGLAMLLLAVLFVAVVYCCFVVRTVYDDHMAIAARLRMLEADNKRLDSDLGRRKEFMVAGDPAYGGMLYMAEQFGVYGFEVGGRPKGKPCTILTTAPPDSASIAEAVHMLAGSVSGCRAFGFWEQGNPDIEEVIAKGSVPGVVVLHADRGNAAANSLAINLQSEFVFRRSYEPMQSHVPLYGGQGDPNDSVIWLQFGSGIGHLGHD